MYQVKTSGQCKLRDKKKHQCFSIVSLPTDSVIFDHAVYKRTYIKSPVELYYFIVSNYVEALKPSNQMSTIKCQIIKSLRQL
jgi:hypothetical protein